MFVLLGGMWRAGARYGSSLLHPSALSGCISPSLSVGRLAATGYGRPRRVRWRAAGCGCPRSTRKYVESSGNTTPSCARYVLSQIRALTLKRACLRSNMSSIGGATPRPRRTFYL
eukprot:scaffold70230_cov25-Tisochrysis_lutea.AAC.1